MRKAKANRFGPRGMIDPRNKQASKRASLIIAVTVAKTLTRDKGLTNAPISLALRNDQSSRARSQLFWLVTASLTRNN